MINVSNIERFATHDGPGIRTTVFLKGCPLHCPWCANPETWMVSSTLMHDEKKCTLCRNCEKACTHDALYWMNGQFGWNASKCIGCYACMNACINDALTMNGTWMKEEDVITEVMKDKDYYDESNGGVTFSGGEPFYQYEELRKLLLLAKKHGLHTVVETTGNYSKEHLSEAMSDIDLFLFDIKSRDPRKLHRIIGADPYLIYENLEYLAGERGQDVIVRMPVIPGFNENEIDDIIAYAERNHVLQVNLLPYHNLGKRKWHQLGRKYQYEDEKMMPKEHLKQYESGFVKIGG